MEWTPDVDRKVGRGAAAAAAPLKQLGACVRACVRARACACMYARG
jgi:hypothetical protein